MFPLGETYRARSSPSKAQAPPAGAAPPGAGTTTHQAPHPALGTPSSAETPLGTPGQHRHTRCPRHLPCHQPCTNNHSTGLVYMRILHWKLSRFCKLIFPQAHTWKFQDPSAVTTAHHTQILLLFHHDLGILLQ